MWMDCTCFGVPIENLHRKLLNQCATCSLYNAILNPSDEQRKDYEEHVLCKTTSRTAMHNDIAHCAEDPEQVVVTMDLQSVLQIPQAETSPFYYKRKLCVYNFTIYNEANRDGPSFLLGKLLRLKIISIISTETNDMV
uniref:Uncharacterized protein n=1 Tax=Romanomermis culicivorax TaxID=13658 RepID=A0A915IHG5_ROMCU